MVEWIFATEVEGGEGAGVLLDHVQLTGDGMVMDSDYLWDQGTQVPTTENSNADLDSWDVINELNLV